MRPRVSKDFLPSGLTVVMRMPGRDRASGRPRAAWTLLALLVAIVVGVQSGAAKVKVRSDFNKAFAFTQARTWGWNPKGPGDIMMARTPGLPNVAHWSTYAHLARGSWPRKPEGIFDATHLRWFIREQAPSVLKSKVRNIVVHAASLN